MIGYSIAIWERLKPAPRVAAFVVTTIVGCVIGVAIAALLGLADAEARMFACVIPCFVLATSLIARYTSDTT